jgi:hypothetical protein
MSFLQVCPFVPCMVMLDFNLQHVLFSQYNIKPITSHEGFQKIMKFLTISLFLGIEQN